MSTQKPRRGQIFTDVRMKVMGIDPGLSGAWCIVEFENKKILGSTWGKFPTFKRQIGTSERSEYDVPRLRNDIRSALDSNDVRTIYMEHVWSFPKDTPMTAFKFGKGVGLLEMAIASAGRYKDVVFVPPQTWEGIMHLGITKKLTPKKRSQYRIFEIFPELLEDTKSDGVHDAFLIAVYGYFKETGIIIR